MVRFGSIKLIYKIIGSTILLCNPLFLLWNDQVSKLHAFHRIFCTLYRMDVGRIKFQQYRVCWIIRARLTTKKGPVFRTRPFFENTIWKWKNLELNPVCNTLICITGLIYWEYRRSKTKCCEVIDFCGEHIKDGYLKKEVLCAPLFLNIVFRFSLRNSWQI